MRALAGAGIRSAAIHGNKSQGQRTAALKAFKDNEIKVLIATDIAARGIDITGVSHVFNYDLPNVAEQYVHRIGRTARNGADGIAIAFVSGDERGLLKDIERLTKVKPVPMPLPKGFSEAAAQLPPRSRRPSIRAAAVAVANVAAAIARAPVAATTAPSVTAHVVARAVVVVPVAAVAARVAVAAAVPASAASARTRTASSGSADRI